MDDFPKIITAEQTRAVDAFTIKNNPISSIDLMEQAAKAFVEAFVKKSTINKTVAVICGIGNNGGDGFAVARILLEKGYTVTTFLIKYKSSLSTDCSKNFEKIKEVKIIEEEEIPDFSVYDITIDALLGTGLKRPIAGFLKVVVTKMNTTAKVIYAIDLPTGLFCDTVAENSTAIKADYVISFQRPKLAFFFPEYGAYIQNWKVVNIGLDESFIQQQDSQFYLLTDRVKKILKKRKRFSHKGIYGHALIIAGAYGKIGAAILAAKACLKSGVGLLSVQIPKCGYQILQISIPEAMCLVDQHKKYFTSVKSCEKYSTIGIGPGLGKHPKTLEAFTQVLTNFDKPMVIDADAINLLAENENLLSQIPKYSILTPHIKEFDRLIGTSSTSLERFEKQRHFAKKYQLIVVLKDAHTSIADPLGKIYFNTSGNPAMATGGSGDVLTGIITGLLSQQYTPLEAATLGVYFHGLAGDNASEDLGELSVVASDIINNLHF